MQTDTDGDECIQMEFPDRPKERVPFFVLSRFPEQAKTDVDQDKHVETEFLR
jgi:hypothetical protein